MIRISFLLLFLVSISLNGQNNAIGVGEKLTYTASYNMSGILTDLAEVTMETSAVKTSKTTLLRLKSKATTYSKWDSFFKNMKYTFSHKTKTVKTVQKKKSGWVQKKTVPIGADTKDIISTLYTIRTFDLSNLSPGTSKIFTILFYSANFAANLV